ncbi:uncharacterized protein O8D03_012971 isoform 2-T2 [Erethizon dorsatum]
MSQGEGSYAARGGALGLGAGRGTKAGGTSERVLVEGGARQLGAGPGLLGGGAWPLEEERELVAGGALCLEAEGGGTQALGAGLHPVCGAAPVQEKGSSSAEGGAAGNGAELRSVGGGTKEPSEGLSPSNAPGRPRGGGLRGGRAWGRET